MVMRNTDIISYIYQETSLRSKLIRVGTFKHPDCRSYGIYQRALEESNSLILIIVTHKTRALNSILSRRGASLGVVGSTNAVCGVRTATLPSILESKLQIYSLRAHKISRGEKEFTILPRQLHPGSFLADNSICGWGCTERCKSHPHDG